MTPAVIIGLALIVCFLLGVLTGSGQVTRTQDARDRSQAAVQRDLNLQFRVLQEQQEAAEEELRWLSKQQSGLVVIDYDEDKEVPTKDQQLPRQPRRPA
jgi:hypothetical protein